MFEGITSMVKWPYSIYLESHTELDYSDNGYGDNDLDDLIDVLHKTTILEKLNLGHNKIQLNLEPLAEAIASNRTVRVINLAFNEIDRDGAKRLSNALRHKNNNTLQEIGLDSNRIGDDGALAIKHLLIGNTAIKRVLLASNNISSKGAKFLADALEKNERLEYFSLGFLGGTNKIGDEGAGFVANALKINNKLKALSLDANNITSKGAESLSEALETNKSLTDLILRFNKIGNKGANSLGAALKVNNHLVKLNLHGNCIDSEGVESLADGLTKNESLQGIDLGGNRVGDRGAGSLGDALKVNNTLLRIQLPGSNIGSAGAASLADGIKFNKGLRELDLTQNEIDSRGAKSLADALEMNQTLEKLVLTGNQIDDDGGRRLMFSLNCNTTLKVLDLSDNKVRWNTLGMIRDILEDNKKQELGDGNLTGSASSARAVAAPTRAPETAAPAHAAEKSSDNPNHVVQWLQSNAPSLNDKDLLAYAKSLIEDGFDSDDALATLVEEDLQFMKKGHRRVLLKNLNEGKARAEPGAGGGEDDA